MKDNKIKEILNNIKVNKELDDKILAKTIYKKNNLLLQKCIIAFSIIIIIGFTSYGITRAIIKVKTSDRVTKEYDDIFVTTKIEKKENCFECRDRYLTDIVIENKKEVNYDANMNEIINTSDQYYMTYDKLEKKLNTKFLKSDKFNNNNKLRISLLRKNEDKISKAGFAIDDCIKNKKEKISMYVIFITKYYEEEKFTKLLGQTYDNYWAPQKIINNKLNTDLYFYPYRENMNNDTVIPGSLYVHFIYDDVLYSFGGTNTSINNLIEVVNSLHY